MNFVARGCMYCEGECNKECLKEAAEKLKGRELFKESNDRARKMLSEVKSLPIETLEEAAEKYGNSFGYDEHSVQEHLAAEYGFIAGAKWQQEQDKNKYSEEDMIKFAFDTYHYISKLMGVPFNQISENKLHAMYNFEQFKNK